MTQIELAKRLGMSNSYLSEVESGLKEPSVELLRAYSKVFGIPVSSILLFSESIGGNERTSERIRVGAAKKILRFLEWIDEQEVIKGNA
jgi:transcriptional regulator with XRE-family HTH domain